MGISKYADEFLIDEKQIYALPQVFRELYKLFFFKPWQQSGWQQHIDSQLKIGFSEEERFTVKEWKPMVSHERAIE